MLAAAGAALVLTLVGLDAGRDDPPVQAPAAGPRAAVPASADASRSAAAPAPGEMNLARDEPLRLCTGEEEDGTQWEWPELLGKGVQHARMLQRASVTPPDDADAGAPLAFALQTPFAERDEKLRGRLERVLDRDPDHKLALWQMYLLCHEHVEFGGCDERRVEERLRVTDSDNAQLWALMALRAERAGDAAAATRALAQAAAGSRATHYFPEVVAEVYRANADLDGGLALTQAVGAAAIAGLPDMGAVIGLCREPGQAEVRRRACMDYGSVLERGGRSLLLSSIGIGLQRSLLDEQIDAAAIGELDQRQDRLMALVQQSAPWSADIVFLDRSFIDDYVQDLVSAGEAVASERGIEAFRQYVLDVRAGRLPDPCPAAPGG